MGFLTVVQALLGSFQYKIFELSSILCQTIYSVRGAAFLNHQILYSLMAQIPPHIRALYILHFTHEFLGKNLDDDGNLQTGVGFQFYDLLFKYVYTFNLLGQLQYILCKLSTAFQKYLLKIWNIFPKNFSKRWSKTAFLNKILLIFAFLLSKLCISTFSTLLSLKSYFYSF